MPARNVSVFVTGLAIAVMGACSNPAADDALGGESDLSSELELALFSASAMAPDEGAVVSALELARPRAPEQSASAPPAARSAAPAAERADPVARLVLAEMVTERMAPTELSPVTVVAGGSDAGDAAAEGGSGAERRDGPQVGRSGGRGIIIRGGVTGGDPCINHAPAGRRHSHARRRYSVCGPPRIPWRAHQRQGPTRLRHRRVFGTRDGEDPVGEGRRLLSGRDPVLRARGRNTGVR